MPIPVINLLSDACNLQDPKKVNHLKIELRKNRETQFLLGTRKYAAVVNKRFEEKGQLEKISMEDQAVCREWERRERRERRERVGEEGEEREEGEGGRGRGEEGEEGEAEEEVDGNKLMTY